MSDGTIVVEHTFDVTELKELPPVPSIPPMSPAAPKRTICREAVGMFNDTARLFEKSSEEDLVEARCPRRGPKE